MDKLWLTQHLEIVYFIYGLSFVVLGVAILAAPRKEVDLPLARPLLFLAAYAFLHAPADFIDMWAGRTSSDLAALSELLTFVSYMFLFEFGRRLLGLSWRNIPWWIMPVLAAGVLVSGAISDHFLLTLNNLAGYFLRLPAGIMSGLGFIFYFRLNNKAFEPFRVRRFFYAAGGSMLFWAFFCGLVRSEGGFFPSTVLNTSSFQAATGLHVHLFRTLCAMVLTWAVISILGIFNLKRREALSRLVTQLEDSLAQVKTLRGLLPICAACKKVRDDKGYWTQIEEYVRDHSEADFSHGMCPDCYKEWYPEFSPPSS